MESPVNSETGASTALAVDRARSAAFALFSRLVASPFDISASGKGLLPDDLDMALDELSTALPYPTDFGKLKGAAAAMGPNTRDTEREYGAIFEVGRNGPPLPIRQELLYDETKSAQKKEEIVRFYEHFSYPLNPERQWAPDHLSVALEFQHFLAFRAAKAEDPAPFVLAARDFSSRHLADWTSMLAQTVAHRSEDTYLKTLFQAVAAFVRADLEHLQQRPETKEA